MTHTARHVRSQWLSSHWNILVETLVIPFIFWCSQIFFPSIDLIGGNSFFLRLCTIYYWLITFWMNMKYCNLCIRYSFRKKKKNIRSFRKCEKKSDIILFSLYKDILALRRSKYIIIPLEKWMRMNQIVWGKKKKKRSILFFLSRYVRLCVYVIVFDMMWRDFKNKICVSKRASLYYSLTEKEKEETFN